MASENQQQKTKDQARNWARITSNLLSLSSQVTATGKGSGKAKSKVAQASGSHSDSR